MSRPPRSKDDELASQAMVRMRDQHLSMAVLADMVGVDKSTISRSLATRSFSQPLAARLRDIVEPPATMDDKIVLQKALRKLSASDRLRADAGRMLQGLLDRSARKA